MDDLARINGVEVTHVFKRTNQDCIIIDDSSELKIVKFLDGSESKIHRTHLLPIRKTRRKHG